MAQAKLIKRRNHTEHFFTVPALCVEIKAADSLDDTLGEQAVDETLGDSEVRGVEFIPNQYQNDPELQL